MGFKAGKLPWNFLSKLLAMLPTSDIDLIMGPGVGEDAAVIRFKDGFLVIHTDPITAASRRIGWLAIHIAANDIAVRGVKPRWFLPVVLLPENISEDEITSIFKDMGEALNEIDGIVVGGHTEVTPGLDRPIITVTAAGYTSGRVILTRDAKPGDEILIVGDIGAEGVSVVAWDFPDLLLNRGVIKHVVDKAKDYLWHISVVDKALTIKEYVNTMHDPTEGGILQGLREIALASNTSIVLDLDNIVLNDIVLTITKALDLDPLKILSSGTLIATVPAENKEIVKERLEEKRYPYMFCGYVEKGERGKVFLRRNGNIVSVIDNDIIDEIYKLWG